MPVGGASGVGGASAVAAMPESTSCTAQASLASCTEPCVLAYATRLTCPGPVFDLQVADTGLLLEWKVRDPALSYEQTFDFSVPDARLQSERSFGPDPRRRVLARDATRNVVIEENEGGFAVSPFSVARLPGAGFPLAARFEGDTLRVLTKQAASVSQIGAIRELSTERDGNVVLDRSVYPSALDARFIVGHPASALLLVRPSNDPGAPPLRSKDAPYLLYPVEAPVRAIANGEGIAVATPFDGVVEVSDPDGMHLLKKGSGPPAACPGRFTAFNPDVCGTEHPRFTSVEVRDQLLAATVAYTKGAPWLISITGNGSAECRLTTYNSCFETLPCACGYELEEEPLHATLELTRIDLPALSYRVDLGTLPSAGLRVEASSAADAADFTVAIASQGSVDYLLIRGE